MTSAQASLSARFAFNAGCLSMLTRDFAPEDWTRTLDGGNNDAHWILGHVTYSRRIVLGFLGHGVPAEPWMQHFGRGATSGANADYPEPAELVADFRARGEDLARVLGDLSAEEAARPTELELPDGAKTVLDAASFFLFHEIYHLGQISALRLAAGKGGIA